MFRFQMLLCLLAVSCANDAGIEPDTNVTPGDDTEDNDDDTTPVADDLAGGDIDTALAVTFDKDGIFSVEETIGEGGDRDFFALEVVAGTAVRVEALAYGLTGETEPDTVLRIYDEGGIMLWENDDMPYRLLETDSALFFEATYSGVYYLEVLEWSDWAEGSDGALGGPGFEYELFGIQVLTYESEPTNDDREKIYEYISQDDVYAYVTDPFVGEEAMFYGDMSKEGDVDYYPLTVPEPTKTPFNGLYYAISFFGQPLGNLSPNLSIVDWDGNIMAETREPFVNNDRRNFYDYRTFWYDFGLLTYLEPGEYFIRVQNDDPSVYGDGTFYAGIFTGGYYDSLAPFVSDNDQNNVLNGGILELDKKNHYVTVGNTIGVEGDVLDSWTIYVGDVPFSTKYLDLFVMSEQIGGQIDTKVTIYEEDGSTVLYSTSTNDFDGGMDPELIGLELTTDSIFVVVETEGEASPNADANYYMLYASIVEEP
jgi:hypothetical protein